MSETTKLEPVAANAENVNQDKSFAESERTEQIKCMHVKTTSHWLSPEETEELKRLYKMSPEDVIRELGGTL